MSWMASVYTWFSGLATFGGFFCFLVGFLTCYLGHAVKQRYLHRRPHISWLRAGIAVGIAVIVLTSFQSSIAYNLANETATEVQQCQKDFNVALRARAKLAEENDRWSQVQRKALGDWLHAILLPPPDIAALRVTNPNDVKVTEWGIRITTYYSEIVQHAQQQQDAALAERARHPLPDPTCGN